MSEFMDPSSESPLGKQRTELLGTELSHRKPAITHASGARLSLALAHDIVSERMVPEHAPPAVFWEHVYRYRFACNFVEFKRVLDIACGEGYGAAALLKAGAASVIGVDICPEVCEQARRKYGLDARAGRANSIPLPSSSIDVVVSFETIEHLDSPGRFLDECCRVLAPGGRLVVSTPNRDFYGGSGSGNPYHCSELSESEIVALIGARFKTWRVFTQRTIRAKWWSARSLAAVDTPWFRIRGFGRLRQILRGIACTYTSGEVSERYRVSPIEAVLSYDLPLGSIIGEYSIRERGRPGSEEFEYLILVADI